MGTRDEGNGISRLLVADDDPEMLKIIGIMLAGEGYEIVTANDGEAARTLIERDPGRLSAILLDWKMPGLSGIDLLRWIKGHPDCQDTPVIMQTGMSAPEQFREGVDAGAFYYLTKPFDKKVLVSVVRAAVRDSRFKQSLLMRLKESENPFGLLTEGTFRFRTLAEGERLALWIANACPTPVKAMDISELLINAVEHGSLGITYDEKTELVANGMWNKEVERRLALPENMNKFVNLEIRRFADRLTVLVEDDGPGFDFEEYLKFSEARALDNHGRGIAIARTSMQFDYLGSGNRVLVTITHE